MAKTSDDYRDRSETTVELLFHRADELVGQYGRYVDAGEVSSIRRRFASIKLELEQALANYEASEARLIREELRQLSQELQRRVDVAKEALYKAVIERQAVTDL